MLFRNIMENIVWEKIEDLIKAGVYQGCTCDICKNDVAAIALNTLPPKYVVNLTGEAYSKAKYLGIQNSIDISRQIAYAMEVVKNSPRHCEVQA